MTYFFAFLLLFLWYVLFVCILEKWISGASGKRKNGNRVQSKGEKPVIKILRQIAFELFFLAFPVSLFLLITVAALNYCVQVTQSDVAIYVLFYALPLFFPLWIYRAGDGSPFQRNIRRLIVYTIVALVILINKNPVEILMEGTVTADKPTLDTLLPEFWVLAFIAFDRVGRVIVELMADCDH